MERYEAYKDSGVEWIGEIPVGWNCVNLSALVKLRKNRNDGNGETNVLSLSYGCIKRRVLDNSGLLPESFETYNIIEAGDIVLRLTDLQNDQVSLRVGRCGERGIITSAYSTLEPVNALSKFLFYLLASFDYQKGFYGLAGGVRQSLTYDGIKSLKYPLPTWDEQQAIADYLDEKTAEIDSIVSETERSIELLREYRKSVISEAVTKGLDPDAPMKDSGSKWIDSIPDGWNVAPLKVYAKLITDGTHQTPNYVDEGVPFLSIKDMSSGKLSFDDCKYITLSQHEELSKHARVEDGDILFARIGTLGVSVVVHDCPDFDIFVSLGLIKLRPKVMDAYYLNYCMQSDYYFSYIQAVKAGGGTAAAKFNLSDVAASPIVVPPLDTQMGIVSYLDAKTSEIDALIADKERQVELLKEYRKSLISEAVTGKFKVPGVK